MVARDQYKETSEYQVWLLIKSDAFSRKPATAVTRNLSQMKSQHHLHNSGYNKWQARAAHRSINLNVPLLSVLCIEYAPVMICR